MNTHRLFLLILLFTNFYSKAQNKTWDNTELKNWPENFKEVFIPSSIDNVSQGAIFYQAKSNSLRPLIVSLHTWSGNYQQEDPLAKLITQYDYNYIHPDFRGANNNVTACGSKYVISDLTDAIEYAIRNSNVDPNEVHIVGASGGGYATLIAFMNISYPVKSFSAWVPLSNLEDWYWESVGRKQKYGEDIMLCTGSDGSLNLEEARKRSPYFQVYPAELRKNSQLYIYTGIHDGYTGSVPITQSISMYNRLVSEITPDVNMLVSEEDKLELVVKRCFPRKTTEEKLGDRKIHYQLKAGNISLCIFEGGHEQLVEQAIPLIPIAEKYKLKYKTILNLGDSNSSFDYSWPNLLASELINSTLINYAIPGNTIGFDNLGQKRLNTLANIDSVLNIYKDKPFDFVIVSLGTNDCKAIFHKKEKDVVRNFGKLIDKIKKSKSTEKSKIIVLSLPPVDTSKFMNDKYQGIENRIFLLNKKLRNKTFVEKIIFLDIYSLLKPNFPDYTEDGIHLNEKGQLLINKMIIKEVMAQEK